jgi:RHS repeat-associated protein
LLQEQAYYPFGLEMQGITSKAFNKLNTAYKFNGGVELEEETNLYATFYRPYDPQLGRFFGIDIKSEENFAFSTYQFGLNNPIFFNDPLGDDAKAENISAPPTFNTVGEILKYIQENGTGGFPTAFTYYQVKTDGTLTDPMVGGELSQNKNGEWGIKFSWSAMGGFNPELEGGMQTIVVGQKWMSLETLRVNWNQWADEEEYRNTVIDGTQAYIDILGTSYASSDVLTRVLQSQTQLVRQVGSKVVRNFITAGTVGNIISAASAWVDVYQSATIGNVALAFFKTGIAVFGTNPVAGLLISIADVTGLSGKVSEGITTFGEWVGDQLKKSN